MGVCWSLEDPVQIAKAANQKKDASQPNGGSLLAPPKDVKDLKIAGYGNVNIFTFSELKAATKNFRPDQILGEGGFGIVYKGLIDENVRQGFESTQVAVKRLNPDGFQGDKEWLTEVNYLGQLSHPHLVKLIGYCCEGEHRLLVYEYMACGNLEQHLFRRVSLTMSWATRMKIALGAAKGLAFLHSAERSIIYRDFKTSNILLDSEYNAKLSDFGLAKEGPTGEQTHVSTRVMGTYGYAAPEYVMTGHLTARSDVYGFGVVLLEMIIGRRAMDKSRPSREHNLVEWARPLLIHNRKLLKIIDPRLEGQYSNKVATEVAALAYKCLSQNPKGRPTMCQVVETLESLKDLPESREDLLLQGINGVVTLYEVKDPVDNGSVRNGSSKTEGPDETLSSTKLRNGSSKTEGQEETLSSTKLRNGSSKTEGQDETLSSTKLRNCSSKTQGQDETLSSTKLHNGSSKTEGQDEMLSFTKLRNGSSKTEGQNETLSSTKSNLGLSRRTRRNGTSRSRSEPPAEFLFIPSPDLNSQQSSDLKSISASKRIAKPSVREDYEP